MLGKWKSDYEHLYNNGKTDVFDDEHLKRVKELLNNPDTPEFPKSDCSSLNCPITYEEVRKAVYEAKLRKASGIDGIPAEVLRNETCIDLLFKIVSYAFANGKVPSEWSKGIIKPLPKGDDTRNPLNYRPITIISIPCKIYANILNKRLLLWLEENGLIADEQNGFRKNRSCQDHVYALYSLIHNRKLRKKETYTCFVDCRKAFDTVNRDCLWFKLMSLGIHGKILQAIQSLYVNVSCAVKVNEHFTDFFPAQQGLKQGCGLSPALFSIYINDLAAEINALHCGIKFDNNEVSILLYADDVVLIAESADDLQNMLNTLNNWCNKWRLAVNESKTKIVHFRNKNQSRSNFIFQCGEKVITFEHEYKYLGFWFNEYDLEKSVTEVSKAASRALGAVYMKYLHTGGMSYDVYTKMIETIVEPVLFYCSGIWGTRKFPKVQSVLNKACRYFLGVTKNAPNIATRGDMGWVAAEVKQKLECVRLWCRLKNMPESRTAHRIHQWSLSMSRSWENVMLKHIEDLELQNYMLTQSPNKSACLKAAREKMTQLDISNWENALANNGTDANNRNKLRTYRTYKNKLNTEYYVKLNMRRDHRRILARFRSCNLPLAIETGRFTKPKTPLNQRLCRFCKASVIEDETHFLISCDFYSDLRYDLFKNAADINETFPTMFDSEKLIFLMNNDLLQYKIASTLQQMVRRRRSTATQ